MDIVIQRELALFASSITAIPVNCLAIEPMSKRLRSDWGAVLEIGRRSRYLVIRRRLSRPTHTRPN
jgi:hypothetical protein